MCGKEGSVSVNSGGQRVYQRVIAAIVYVCVCVCEVT